MEYSNAEIRPNSNNMKNIFFNKSSAINTVVMFLIVLVIVCKKTKTINNFVVDANRGENTHFKTIIHEKPLESSIHAYVANENSLTCLIHFIENRKLSKDT